VTWFRVDDGFYDHPKVKSLPRGPVRKGAIFLWNQAGSWCCRYLQNGLVPPHMISELGATRRDAEALVACDLWHTAGHDCADCPDIPRGHYLFHQWSQYQPTRDQVEAERDAARKRMQERRRGSGRNSHEPTADVRELFK
jgi:hypothetical protein